MTALTGLEGLVKYYTPKYGRPVRDIYNREVQEAISYVKSHVREGITPVVTIKHRTLDDLTGAMVYADGTEVGSGSDLEGARTLIRDYTAFKNSEAGRELSGYLGKDAEFDGYMYADLGKRALAAVIKTADGKSYLAINKAYANRIDDLTKLYVLAHEEVHGAGEHSEKRTEGKLKQFFSRLSEKARGYAKRVYQSLAQQAELREKYA